MAPRRSVQPANETGEVTTSAEAGLRSEAGQVREQARKARTPVLVRTC